MKINETNFDDLFIIDLKEFKDSRGAFVKTIHKETFLEANINWNFTESFFSVSHKDVLRGMHYQTPPEHHDKLVYVVSGKILDVALDLRYDKPTYGQYFAIELSSENRQAIFIGKGFAHGFLSLENKSIVEYHTSTSQDKEHEMGVLWNSFGFNWPVNNPIISERDLAFKSFSKLHRI